MDLIDRQEAIKALCKAACGEYCNIPCDDVMAVQNLPSIDAVEVVRCKDCMLCQYDAIFKQYWCIGKPVKADDYCSMGVRKKDG